MDTEGAEIKILRGMLKLLGARKVANLVVEIRKQPAALDASGASSSISRLSLDPQIHRRLWWSALGPPHHAGFSATLTHAPVSRAPTIAGAVPPNWSQYGVSLTEGARVLRSLTTTLGYKAYLMWDVRHDKQGMPLAGVGPDLAPDAHPAGARCQGSSATLRPIVDWDALVAERVEHRAGGNIWFTRQFG